MGGIILSTADFFDELSEILGYKAGLVLDEQDIRKLLTKQEELAQYAELPKNGVFRIRSEVVEIIVEYLLFSVGRLERIGADPMIELYHRYRKNKKKRDQWTIIGQKFTAFLEQELLRLRGKNKALDPTPFIMEIAEEFGVSGLRMAMAAVESLSLKLFKSPWGVPTLTFKDTIELRDLFKSEGLTPLYGSFIDQRHIDFLNRNFDSIDKINWRKFEGLTGEFFDRAGFEVKLGSGRNDDGVDVRVWPKSKSKDDPPTLIVQCKRQKARVEKVVVKSLYADILSEDAKSGLVVTTSRLSPGARKVCTARGYPIKEADRATLRQWVKILRKPGAGSFL